MSISHQKSLARFRRFVRSDQFYSSREWRLAKIEAKRRSDYRCSGTRCKEREGLEVHHVISRQIEPDKALDQTNLIVLCPMCHQAYHHWIKGFSPYSSIAAANDAQFKLPFGESIMNH